MPTLFFYNLYVRCTGMVWYGMVWYGMVWYGDGKQVYAIPFSATFTQFLQFSTLYNWKSAYHCKKQCQTYISIPGCDINCKNWIGNTPLCIAASHGNTRLIKYLLRKGILDRKLV